MARRSQDPILFTTMALSVIFGKIASVALYSPAPPAINDTQSAGAAATLGGSPPSQATTLNDMDQWTRTLDAASKASFMPGAAPTRPVQSDPPTRPCEESAEQLDPFAPPPDGAPLLD